jgi:hypothetical protein
VDPDCELKRNGLQEDIGKGEIRSGMRVRRKSKRLKYRHNEN